MADAPGTDQPTDTSRERPWPAQQSPPAGAGAGDQSPPAEHVTDEPSEQVRRTDADRWAASFAGLGDPDAAATQGSSAQAASAQSTDSTDSTDSHRQGALFANGSGGQHQPWPDPGTSVDQPSWTASLPVPLAEPSWRTDLGSASSWEQEPTPPAPLDQADGSDPSETPAGPWSTDGHGAFGADAPSQPAFGQVPAPQAGYLSQPDAPSAGEPHAGEPHAGAPQADEPDAWGRATVQALYPAEQAGNQPSGGQPYGDQQAAAQQAGAPPYEARHSQPAAQPGQQGQSWSEHAAAPTGYWPQQSGAAPADRPHPGSQSGWSATAVASAVPPPAAGPPPAAVPPPRAVPPPQPPRRAQPGQATQPTQQQHWQPTGGQQGPPPQYAPAPAGPQAPPPPPQYASAADLTSGTLVKPSLAVPSTGWRKVVHAVTGGTVNPGLSQAELSRRDLIARITTPVRGCHRIAVVSLKGGIGKTTTTAGLGLTLAEHRGDRVVALDANPDAGTLAERLTGHVNVTVRDLLDNVDSIRSFTDVSAFTSLAARLQVLASDQDPELSEAFSEEEYRAVSAVLARYFNIVLTDSGTGLLHSAMSGTLALADTLVVVGSPSVDGASRASKTLDWLIAHSHGELVSRAVAVISTVRPATKELDMSRLREHFVARVRAVVEIPYDRHLVTGGIIDMRHLERPTELALLELTAAVADGFRLPTLVHRAAEA